MPLPRAAAFLLAGSAWLVTPAQADVFMRLGRRPDRILEQAGGHPVFQADVRVNGLPGSLALLGFDRPADALAPLLARKLGLPAPTAGIADGAHIAGLSKGRALDLILLPGGNPDTTLALLVDRRAADANNKNAAGIDWPDIPHPASATPIVTAANLATRTTLAVAATQASSDGVHAEMEAQLTGGGWQPAAPRGQNGGLAIYTRSGAIMLVFTQTSPDGRTRITLLQRQGHTP